MGKLRVIDLFSGAGGLTFGFYYKKENEAFIKRNNVEFVFSNEFAPQAVTAFKKNYGDDIEIFHQVKVGDTWWGCIGSGKWICMDYVGMG